MPCLADKLAAERLKDTDLYLVTGGKNDNGLPVWHYVRVPPLRRNAFMRALVSGDVTFDEFGKIALSGYGASPPEHIQQRMLKSEHGSATA